MDALTGKICSHARFIIFPGVLFPALVFAQATGHIQKCQDATGKWHYGGHTNLVCNSTISVLNASGITISSSAPFTPVSRVQQAAVKQQKLSDQRLLQRYSSIRSIEQEKLRKVTELAKQQNINMELIDEMGSDMLGLGTLNSPASKTAMDERQAVIRQYQSIYKLLSQRIDNLSSEYDEILSDYIQAKARTE